jgi:deoxyribonucleoside regulator
VLKLSCEHLFIDPSYVQFHLITTQNTRQHRKPTLKKLAQLCIFHKKHDKEECIVEELDLLSEVARMYYENNLTQSEIAKQIHTSRSTVSRLLQEAREKRVVEITIHYPWDRASVIEQELQKTFQLKDVRVLEARDRKGEEALNGVAMLAARYIAGIIKEDTILGMSWGRTIYTTVQILKADRELPVKVVQLFGAAIPNNKIDGPELVRQFASKYNGDYYSIHAPLFVESPEARQALLQNPHIKETIALAQKATIVLTGIGSLESPYAPSQTWLGYLTKEVIAQLRKQGAVGHVCAHHYDIHGRILDLDLHGGIIGAGLGPLHTAPQVIAVASGEEKARAILGVLRGKHVNTLITDDVTALKVLSLAE